MTAIFSSIKQAFSNRNLMVITLTQSLFMLTASLWWPYWSLYIQNLRLRHPPRQGAEDEGRLTPLQVARVVEPPQQPLIERSHGEDREACLIQPEVDFIDASLTIQSLREYPYSVDDDQFKFLKKDAEGYWRLPGDPLPLMYSIKAMKPAA